MIVYEANKANFLRDCNDREIDDVIRERFISVVGHDVAINEVRSWRESLGHVARVLSDADIPDNAGVAVEYHIPQTAKRLDVLVSGFGESGSKNAVVIELKQWEAATSTQMDGIVITYLGGARREVVHPSYQAWSYSELLKGFNSAVYDGEIGVWPCAYLHNYRSDGQIDADFYEPYTSRAPVFLKGEEDKARLRKFIKQHVRSGDDGDVLREIDRGKILPSKALADSVLALLKGKAEFVLIDDQKSVFEAAKAAALSATATAPRVVIVEGGPGTGKSVVAVNLLVDLIGTRLNGKYVSKNAAPRKVYEAKLTGQMSASKFRSLFVGSGAFIESHANAYEFLIVDEAHRLNEKSGLYGIEGDHQIREIVSAAHCAVFFIDEDQRVTLKDIGTKEQIRDAARGRGAAVEEYSLASQFRCAGSNSYLAWLDDVLDIRETVNKDLSASEFDFRVFDSPDDLHRAIEERNGENRARVVAGYCWPWKSKKQSGAVDIEIGSSYKRRWNLGADGSLWIISPTSINEVGCIHTCQGLEVDYIGVIVGPDLVVHEGRVRTVPEARARQDQSIKGYKRAAKRDPAGTQSKVDMIIKNTYRTLMTRGMKGCYVYCTDPGMAARFRERLAGQDRACLA